MNDIKGKINSIGKVCRVLALIFMIVMIISTAAQVILGTVLSLMPQDLIGADVTVDAEVKVDGRWLEELPKETSEEMAEFIKDRSLTSAYGMIVSAPNMEIKDGNVIFRTGTETVRFTLRKFGLAMLSSALVTGSLIAVALMLMRMMKRFAECGTPFSEEVVKSMTGFAISLIPYAVIKQISSSLTTSLLVTGKFSISFGVDLSHVLVILVIVLLIMIFKYGAKLQKDSNETL